MVSYSLYFREIYRQYYEKGGVKGEIHDWIY